MKKLLLILTILLPVYFFLYKIYMPRVNAFGCFDDCASYVSAFFMLKGKQLYSEISYNHQIIMPYLSFVIQKITQPANIYELVLRHRQFLLLFGFVFNILIALRFGVIGILFTLTYEFSKFYYFGDRFLAEALIVYPLVYMVGLAWNKLQKNKLTAFDYIFTAVFSWFVIFSREPYSITAGLLLIFILIGKPYTTGKKLAAGIFTLLVLTVLASTDIKEYFFNVVTVNNETVLKGDIKGNNIFGTGILKSFFYPLWVLVGGEWNLLRYLIATLSAVFLIIIAYSIKNKRNLKSIFILFIVLGSANLRYANPGAIFYGAFHMLVWYGMFIMAVFLMWKELNKYHKKISLLLLSIIILVWGYTIISPRSFIKEKIDTQAEYISNYGEIIKSGEVIKILSEPDDTLFLDGFDDLIYWQANLISNYKYSWYTSMMPGFKVYSSERDSMIKNNPPDFYYGTNYGGLKDQFTQLYSEGKPTNIFINNKKLKNITKEQWNKAKQWLFDKPLLQVF